MSEWQPSAEAQRDIEKLVLRVIDWGELPVLRNFAEVSFDSEAPPQGAVRPDASMVFPEWVGQAFEPPQQAAELRRAAHAITLTALNKRIEKLPEGETDGPARLRLDEVDRAADQFVNDGLREAYWAANGDRICLRLKPELGPELLDVPDLPAVRDGAPGPVARDAALALASSYGEARGEWPDLAVRELLEAPRDEVFETVVDGKLAAQLRDGYTPETREALSELRGRLSAELRTGFEQLSREPELAPGTAHARVAELMKPIDESAQTVRLAFTARSAQQSSQPAATADAKPRDNNKHRWTGFGR
ncbi:hypothetical protein GCM10009804_33600 [Kribbella hippodromi]|uniref:DUF222 domain-containing protein n=1 Tax=Kribbella hippodromi TaxID=434347 RepID=A0ABN2DBW8_9ACTN